MVQLQSEDVKWCLRRLPKDVFNLMKKEGPSIMLAGGFIRSCIANEKINDIDLFSTTDVLAENYSLRLAVDANHVRKTENASTIIGRRPVVQFIHKWVFERPEDVILSFDFTIACAVIWFDETWHSLCSDTYYSDLAARRLVYLSPNRIEEVGGSLLRVLKFYQRGYRIPLDSLAGVIARIMTGIDMNKVTNESEWANVITGLLKEVDPQIDPNHVAHLPSKRETVE